MIACAPRCRALELSRCFITQWWFQSCFSKSVTAKAKANIVYWKGLAAWLDRGRPLKPFYSVCGGKVSPVGHLPRERFTPATWRYGWQRGSKARLNSM